jgi:hypothetical protein
MNLSCWFKNLAGAFGRAVAAAGIFRQTRRRALFYSTLIMPFSAQLKFSSFCLTSLALSAMAALAQTNYYGTNGTEYAIIGSLPGDQVFPDAAISPAGGFVVWQDNITDGDGWGISARRLDSTLSGTLGTFRVNAVGAGNQENPRVALLKNGGAVFVWQGGTTGFQHVYARFLSATNTFLTTNDVLVDAFTKNFQINPAVAVLNNSNVVVVWSSYNEASSNSMQDVYGQIFSPAGQAVGGEFLVNQFTSFNQRAPSVAALPGGGFVVAWVSEQERQLAPAFGNNLNNFYTASSASALNPSVDIYARQFTATGTAAGSEFLVNTDNRPCANPSVTAAADGSFLIAWTVRDMANPSNGLDVFARAFTAAGSGGTAFYVNTHVYGDQYVPRVAAVGLDYLVTWTSLAQDGSREGVYGQFIHNDGSLVGSEFRVNTTTIGQQMQPTVASDGANQFLVVWTSFTGYPNTFDLYAQRYLNVQGLLQAMSAPFVWAPFVISNGVYQPQLVVNWPVLLGLSVASYEVYVDGAATPLAVVSSNQWTMTAANGLVANVAHSFQVDYVTTAGRRSPISPATSGHTWLGYSWGGIPFEWMMAYYGSDTSTWPSASSRPAAGGPTLYQIFLSGGNPNNSATWLQTTIAKTAQGMFLNWNTQAGATYQVQFTTNFINWSNLGAPRFAAGTTDSIYVGGSSVGYYRVMLLR